MDSGSKRLGWVGKEYLTSDFCNTEAAEEENRNRNRK